MPTSQLGAQLVVAQKIVCRLIFAGAVIAIVMQQCGSRQGLLACACLAVVAYNSITGFVATLLIHYYCTT